MFLAVADPHVSMPLFPFSTLKPESLESSELSDRSITTATTPSKPSGFLDTSSPTAILHDSNGYGGFGSNRDSHSFEHLVGHARRQKRKAKELMNALRFNYFLYIPILVIDLTIIGLMAWACTPMVQNQTYKGGKGRVGPLVLLICTCLCLIYTTIVLWRTKYKLGMPFIPRILGLVCITCPGYLVGAILLVQTSSWVPVTGTCGSLLSSDTSCSATWGTLNAIELMACVLAALAAFLSAVDAANVITTHIVYSKRRNRS